MAVVAEGAGSLCACLHPRFIHQQFELRENPSTIHVKEIHLCVSFCVLQWRNGLISLRGLRNSQPHPLIVKVGFSSVQRGMFPAFRQYYQCLNTFLKMWSALKTNLMFYLKLSYNTKCRFLTPSFPDRQGAQRHTHTHNVATSQV